MIGRIFLALGLAGAAAVVLAQVDTGAEFDLDTLRDVTIDKYPVNVVANGEWSLGGRYKIGFDPSPQLLYVSFDAPEGISSQPVDVRYTFSLDGRYGCDDGYAFLRALARKYGFEIASLPQPVCKPARGGGVTSEGRMTIGKASAPQVMAQQCKSDAYIGAWQRKGEGAQKPQVQIVFATERGASAPVGSTRGFASAPYGDGTVVASRIRQVGDSCTFDAQCGSNLSSANACKLVIDPAKNTLKVEGGSQMFISDRVWTRSAPMAAEAMCSREDVEGDWRRSDGANVPIVGVHVFKNGPGGNALLFNHPEGWWPKGQTKFTGIYREGGDRSCKLKATCATYDRTASGTVVRRERACTLTIDPVKKRMTESGSSLFYTREGAAKAPVAKPDTAVTAASKAPSAEEQAATSALNAQQAETAKREIAEYEAQKKRIADEQAAKEAAYRKALADREALIAENERKAREAYTKWEAAAAACRAGDQSQCAPQPKP